MRRQIRSLIERLFRKWGFEPTKPIISPEPKPDFDTIVRSCSKGQLNALFYKIIEVSSLDPTKKGLFIQWRNKICSAIDTKDNKPKRKKGKVKPVWSH